MSSKASVIIPTCGRAGILQKNLERILACSPAPGEILVQIDASDVGTATMLEKNFAGRVAWEQSEETTGPGGGRKLLIQRAKNPVVVSFDDDSWPEDGDFFARAVDRIARHPNAAVLACSVRVKGSARDSRAQVVRSRASFENCGCVMRREAFGQISGYVPLRYAYGMEELDVALQLLDRGWSIRYAPDLRVYHDTEMNHHPSAEGNAAQITNTALLAFLRYPASLWPLGVAQTFNRVRYALSVGRFRGIAKGLAAIPFAFWKYRGKREPVKKQTVELARRLRK